MTPNWLTRLNKAEDEVASLRAQIAIARRALEDARAILDPDVGLPDRSNRDVIRDIDAVLSAMSDSK